MDELCSGVVNNTAALNELFQYCAFAPLLRPSNEPFINLKSPRELVVVLSKYLIGLKGGRDDSRTLRIQFLKKEVVLILSLNWMEERNGDNAPVESGIITLGQQWVVGAEETWDVRSLNCWNDYFCSQLLKKSPEETLYEQFFLALLDHLIATFSHRFLCDNLVAKRFDEYVDLVFDCTSESVDDEITLYSGSTVSELKKTFRKNIKTEFDAFKRMINASVGLFADSSGIDISYNMDELLLAPNWIFTLSTLQNTKRNPYRVESKRNQGQIEKRFRFAIKRNQRNQIDTFVDFSYILRIISSRNCCFPRKKRRK